MKILKIIALLLLVSGIALAGLSVYAHFNNDDEATAERYSAEQTRILTEALRAEGTPRKRELIREYEALEDVTELAWHDARQTRQTIILVALGGLGLIVASVVMLTISRKRSSARSV